MTRKLYPGDHAAIGAPGTPATICGVCAERRVSRYKGLCDRCYQHRRRHGYDLDRKPKATVAPDRPCGACGEPIESSNRQLARCASCRPAGRKQRIYGKDASPEDVPDVMTYADWCETTGYTPKRRTYRR